MNIELDVHRVNGLSGELYLFESLLGELLSVAPKAERDEAKMVLDLLVCIERDGAQSQRRLAQELGVALGLVNAYLKRCVGKGLIKVRQIPARRYAYYLTAKGFSEKSRLTVAYLSHSLEFFRQSKIDCGAVLTEAQAQGFKRLALAGCSDLAEICIICGIEHDAGIVLVIDPEFQSDRFVGVRAVASFESVSAEVDAIIITDLKESQKTFELAQACVGRDRVLVPSLLKLRTDQAGADE